MGKSNNSRKGRRGSKQHNGRHHTCHDGASCSYCASNFEHATKKQKEKGTEL